MYQNKTMQILPHVYLHIAEKACICLIPHRPIFQTTPPWFAKHVKGVNAISEPICALVNIAISTRHIPPRCLWRCNNWLISNTWLGITRGNHEPCLARNACKCRAFRSFLVTRFENGVWRSEFLCQEESPSSWTARVLRATVSPSRSQIDTKVIGCQHRDLAWGTKGRKTWAAAYLVWIPEYLREKVQASADSPCIKFLWRVSCMATSKPNALSCV